MDASLRSKAEQLASEIASQAKTVEDLNGLMRLMMKSALERMLNTEMDVHLGRRTLTTAPMPTSGSRRGDRVGCVTPASYEETFARIVATVARRKRCKANLGELTIATPRDRDGTFEPQLIGKHQRRLPGFDEKILALYAKGMTTRDIQEIVKELYGVDVSATLVSEITADLDAEVTAWRTRRLDAVWPIVYLDGIVVHVRGENGRVSQHTMYVAMGVNLEGRKELLGLWLSETEGAKFWLSLPDRPEEPRAARHLRRLRRRAERFCRGDPRGLSADEGATVHRAPGAGGVAVREHARTARRWSPT